VPIQAMTVRELIVDKDGQIVKEELPAGAPRPAVMTTPELKAGQSRKEFEGVFMIKDGKAAFEPVKVGIAGDKYFEVLSGLEDGDDVITGPFASVRSLREGDPVKVDNTILGLAGK